MESFLVSVMSSLLTYLFSSRLEPKAWQLLRRLLSLVPLATAARLLNSSKFFGVLDKTLEEALDTFVSSVSTKNHGIVSGPLVPKPFDVQGSASPDASASSNTIVDEATSSPTRGRKRKRAGTTNQVVQEPPTVGQQWNDLRQLLTAVLQLLRSITELGREPHSSELLPAKDFARENLKSALRSPPRSAAAILAKIVTLIHALLSKAEGPSDVELALDSQEWIKTASEIWDCRVRLTEDVNGNLSNVKIPVFLIAEYRADRLRNALPPKTWSPYCYFAKPISPARSLPPKTVVVCKLLNCCWPATL